MKFARTFILSLVVVAGCASSTPTKSASFGPDTTASANSTVAATAPRPIPSVTVPGVTAIEDLEAHWLCDQQRTAYPTLGAKETELTDRLTTAGIGRPEYDKFKSDMDADRPTRTLVLAAYRAYCSPTT